MKKTALSMTMLITLSILIACKGPLTEIRITDPVDGAKISCNTLENDKTCYINVLGTAILPQDYQVCLFLKFQGAPEGWIGGVPVDMLPESGVWTITDVGVGPVDIANPPNLSIRALITNDTCPTGAKLPSAPASIVQHTISVKR